MPEGLVTLAAGDGVSLGRPLYGPVCAEEVEDGGAAAVGVAD